MHQAVLHKRTQQTSRPGLEWMKYGAANYAINKQVWLILVKLKMWASIKQLGTRMQLIPLSVSGYARNVWGYAPNVSGYAPNMWGVRELKGMCC